MYDDGVEAIGMAGLDSMSKTKSVLWDGCPEIKRKWNKVFLWGGKNDDKSVVDSFILTVLKFVLCFNWNKMN